MNTYAVDFETSYTKDRDIKSLGVIGYLRHPDGPVSGLDRRPRG